MSNESYVLSFEDMVANAFIELNGRSNERVNEIPLAVIEKYGEEVAKKLISEQVKVSFNLSRNNTENFKSSYGDVFSLKEDKNYLSRYSTVILNNGFDIKYLIKRFRGYLPLNLLLAYIDEDVIENGLLTSDSLVKENNNMQKKLGYK